MVPAGPQSALNLGHTDGAVNIFSFVRPWSDGPSYDICLYQSTNLLIIQNCKMLQLVIKCYTVPRSVQYIIVNPQSIVCESFSFFYS